MYFLQRRGTRKKTQSKADSLVTFKLCTARKSVRQNEAGNRKFVGPLIIIMIIIIIIIIIMIIQKIYTSR